MVSAPRPSDAKFKGREKWWFPFGLYVVYFTVKKKKGEKKSHHPHISNQFQTYHHATEKVN